MIVKSVNKNISKQGSFQHQLCLLTKKAISLKHYFDAAYQSQDSLSHLQTQRAGLTHLLTENRVLAVV